MTKSIKIFIVLATLFLAILFDKFWIAANVSWLSDILKMQFELTLPGIKNLTIPRFGFIPVLGITLFVYFLTEIPYKQLKNKIRWKETFHKVRSVFIGLLWIPIFMVVGAFLYALFKSIFPDTAQNIAEAFSATLSFYSFNPDDPWFTLEGSLGTLLGLVLGGYAFSKKVE